MKKWFLGKRVFPRWKLILLVLIGFWSGYVFDHQPYFAVGWALLGIWDFYKKN